MASPRRRWRSPDAPKWIVSGESAARAGEPDPHFLGVPKSPSCCREPSGTGRGFGSFHSVGSTRYRDGGGAFGTGGAGVKRRLPKAPRVPGAAVGARPVVPARCCPLRAGPGAAPNPPRSHRARPGNPTRSLCWTEVAPNVSASCLKRLLSPGFYLLGLLSAGTHRICRSSSWRGCVRLAPWCPLGAKPRVKSGLRLEAAPGR